MSTESPSDQFEATHEGPAASADGGQPARRHRHIIRWALLLVLLVFAARELPREVARWYLAAAVESYANGDFAQAVQSAKRAIAWDPRSARLYHFLAQTELEMGEIQASLDDCDKAIERDSNALDAYLTRTLVYQRLGRHEQAIRDWDVIVDKTRQQFKSNPDAARYALANALNNRAYARALGKMEIDRGLEDIEQAFELLGTDSLPHMLDTRGYLYYLAGKNDLARADLERAVELAEASAQLGMLQRRRTLSDSDLPVPDINTQHELAVLYHHRGLIYERIGKSQLAKADLELAEKMGYDPNQGVW